MERTREKTELDREVSARAKDRAPAQVASSFASADLALRKRDSVAGASQNEVSALQRLAGNRAVQRLQYLQRDDDDLGVPPPPPARPVKRQGGFRGKPTDNSRQQGLVSDETIDRVAGAGQSGIKYGAGIGTAGAAAAAGAAPVREAIGANVGGTMSGHGTFNSGVTSNVSDFGGGLGVATGAIGLGVGIGLGVHGYRERQAALRGPKKNWARHRLGGRTMRSGAWMAGAGAVGATLGGVELGALAKGGGAATSALAPAAFGLMIGAGAITAGKGLWKFGKAASKHFKLGDVQPVTEEGRMWLAKARQQERNKMKVAGFKTLVGGMGVAAGALLLASNPIGWAIGLGAAALGGIGFLAGLHNKFSQRKQDSAEKAKMKEESERQVDQRAPNAGPAPAGPEKRQEVKKQTAEVAAQTHSNLQVGEEMRAAVQGGDGDIAEPVYHSAIEQGSAEGPPFANTYRALRAQGGGTYNKPAPGVKDFLALDSMMILNVLNISKEEITSGHGPELVQAKLSAAEAG